MKSCVRVLAREGGKKKNSRALDYMRTHYKLGWNVDAHKTLKVSFVVLRRPQLSKLLGTFNRGERVKQEGLIMVAAVGWR
jgi:hypothetical protein